MAGIEFLTCSSRGIHGFDLPGVPRQGAAAVRLGGDQGRGRVHTRLAQGFVTNTVLEGATRTVTFANGFVVQEQIVAIDDAQRRLAYHAVGGRASHHNASLQVFAAPDGTSKVLWITDLLPDEMKAPIAQMVEEGALRPCSARSNNRSSP